MKNFCILVCVLLTLNVQSQTSFNMLLDTTFLMKDRSPKAEISPCADGGFAIAGADHDQTFLLKFDSNGNLLWSKSPLNLVSFYGGSTISLLPTSDSGFYMNSQYGEGLLLNLGVPNLHKFDKNGNLLHSKTIENSIVPLGDYGNNLDRMFLEKYNDNLHIIGNSYEYDWNLEELCCYFHYQCKLDSTLSMINRRFAENILYDSLNVPFYVNKINPNWLSLNYFGYQKYDTSGVKFGTNYYNYDSTLFKVVPSITICQDSRNYYSLNQVLYNSQPSLAIHKMDLNMNTQYFMILDTSSSFFQYPVLYMTMNKSENGNILISGLYQKPSLYRVPFMLEWDTAGFVNSVFVGDGTEQSYIDCEIDTINNAVLFLRTDDIILGKVNYRKEFLSSPSCGFNTLNFQPFSVSLADSAVIDSIPPINPTEPQVLFIGHSVLPVSIGPSSPICGVFSETVEFDDNNCVPFIFPNPANDQFSMLLNCDSNNISSIVIINYIGQELPATFYQENNQTFVMNSSSISAGFYSILVKFDSGRVLSRKIIIQN